MAKLKMLKYPKKPKSGASVSTMQNWLKRKSEVDKENNRRKSENKKAEQLRNKIKGIRRS